MTDSERITATFAVSLALHWSIFGYLQRKEPETMVIDAEDLNFVESSYSDVSVSLAAPITFEQMASAGPQDAVSPDAIAAEKRREALSSYLEQISTAIHARRKIDDSGRTLVGNTLFRLSVDRAGAFTSIEWLRKSGSEQLDADALQAVRAASRIVPRPRILGSSPIKMSVAVKYQLGL